MSESTTPRAGHDPHQLDADRLLPHSADGIQEYDNKLPNWWLATFYGAIFFSVFYWAWYHTYDAGLSPEQSYEVELAEATARLEAAALAAVSDAELEGFAADAQMVADGKAVYTTNCVACHTDTGGGSIGPNLTDKFWMHGGKASDIFKTVAKGVPEKGMLAWLPVLGPAKVKQVTAYVLTLRDTNVAGGKAPQGDAYEKQAAPN